MDNRASRYAGAVLSAPLEADWRARAGPRRPRLHALPAGAGRVHGRRSISRPGARRAAGGRRPRRSPTRRCRASCARSSRPRCPARRGGATGRVSAIRHIVLDIGNVLLRWEPDIPYRRLIPDPGRARAVSGDECNGEWLRSTDSGTSWREAEDILIAKFPGDADPDPRVPPALGGDDPGRRRGEPRYRGGACSRPGADVTGLTNFAADTYPIAFGAVSDPVAAARRHGFGARRAHQARPCDLPPPRAGLRPRTRGDAVLRRRHRQRRGRARRRLARGAIRHRRRISRRSQPLRRGAWRSAAGGGHARGGRSGAARRWGRGHRRRA